MNRNIDKEFLVLVTFLFAATGFLFYWYSSAFLTGCLCGLVVTPGGSPKEALLIESYAFASDTNATLHLINSGTVLAMFQIYFVKDSMGDLWRLNNWSPPGQPVAPNNRLVVNIAIGSSAGGCWNGCQYTGTPGAFTSFKSGQDYTVTVVTNEK